MPSKNYKKILFLFLLLLVTSYWLRVTHIHASIVDDLKTKIEERNKQIEEIQKEIEQYQEEIDKNSKMAASLKTEINRLEITKKKLTTDIQLTQKQIESAGFKIESLTLEITAKETEIGEKLDTLGEIIRNINDAESQSLVELTLSHDNFSDFFVDLERLESFQKDINANLAEIKSLKNAMEEEKAGREKEKGTLENLETKLTDQKQLVDVNKKNKNTLLKDTKNKESVYKKLLDDRLAKQRALEEEISAFEEQIRVAIDPESLPSAGSGVLKWPLDKITITQYFGNTPFATQNPQVYPKGGHNGVDFRASVGTPVKSSLSGVVSAIGDTDISCKGVSYGKWVLIDHGNNLSTLYAHFSIIKVSAGQKVETGQVIGYSGDTGYSTGPHLHYGVFVTKAIVGFEYKSKICGTIMRLPIVAPNGYLNPLSYL